MSDIRILTLTDGNLLLPTYVFNDGDKPYIVERESREDGTFHATFCYKDSWEEDGQTVTRYRVYHSEPYGYAYGPVHESVTREDVDGARYAYDDGTHWHFAHCSPDEQIDLAAAARTFTTEQFSIAIAKAQIKVDEATNATVKAQAITKADALVKFAEAAGADAYKRVVGETLGHFHRNPHHDHKRELAIAAIGTVLAAWGEAGKTDVVVRADLRAVNSDASDVKTALEATHTIEWRAARVKRLAAEKAAAEAAETASTETTPSDGE